MNDTDLSVFDDVKETVSAPVASAPTTSSSMQVGTLERSESIARIAGALIGFHKSMGKVKKSSTNPFYKSKYAALPDILSEVDPILVENGLSVVQLPVGRHSLMTMLMHVSGEFIAGTYTMTPKDDTPQGLGSVITYQRRYALGAVLSLNIDEDDDGNTASRAVIKDAAESHRAEATTAKKTTANPVEYKTITVSNVKETDGNNQPLKSKNGREYIVISSLEGEGFYYFGSTLIEQNASYNITYRNSGGFLTISDIAPAVAQP